MIAWGRIAGSHTKIWSIALDGSGASVLFEDPVADVTNMYIDTHRGTPVGFLPNRPGAEIHWIDSLWASRHKALKQAFPGRDLGIVSTSGDFARATVAVGYPEHPFAYYLVDFKTGSASLLGHEYPELAEVELGSVESLDLEVGDGTRLQAHVTLPPRKEGPRPLVVLLDEDIRASDASSFDWWGQFLATRAYAVYQTAITNPRNRALVHEAVRALVEQGVAREGCICIAGAGDGGYMALAAAAFEPKPYACAVSVNGYANVPTMMRHVERLWGPESNTYQSWLEHYGAPRDPRLAADSPVNAAAGIRAPILLMHSYRDSIVPSAQSSAMAKALSASGKAHKYLSLPGEDHWLSSGATRTRLLTELESFLAESLDSRCRTTD